MAIFESCKFGGRTKRSRGSGSWLGVPCPEKYEIPEFHNWFAQQNSLGKQSLKLIFYRESADICILQKIFIFNYFGEKLRIDFKFKYLILTARSSYYELHFLQFSTLLIGLPYNNDQKFPTDVSGRLCKKHML